MLTLRGRLIPADDRLDMFMHRATMPDETLNEINYLDILWFNPRLEEIIIIGLLIIAIGIGAAVLINQRKIKKQLRELLDQKEDKP
jgi:hypothetical protein